MGAVLGAELRSGQGWPQATAGGGAAAALSATSSAQQWRPHNVRGDAGIGQATSSPTRSGRSSKIRRQAAPAPTISTRRFDNFKPVVFDQFHAAGDMRQWFTAGWVWHETNLDNYCYEFLEVLCNMPIEQAQSLESGSGEPRQALNSR